MCLINSKHNERVHSSPISAVAVSLFARLMPPAYRLFHLTAYYGVNIKLSALGKNHRHLFPELFAS